jgi:hypothetical protein
MRIHWCLPVAISLVLIGINSSPADDQANARAIVDKYLTALGGQEKLAKIKAVTLKGKGKFFGLGGDGIDYIGEWAFQGMNQFRLILEIEIMGQKINQTIVVNGDKGWVKINTMLKEMDKETLAEQKEQLYANVVVYAMPQMLKDKSIELSTLGEIEIDKKPAVGVRVSSKGHRDLNLYFDRDSGLMVKGEWRVKDLEGLQGGKEVTQEVFVSDYKEVEGIKQGMKAAIKWDGKPYVDAEFSDFKIDEKLDDSLFSKP